MNFFYWEPILAIHQSFELWFMTVSFTSKKNSLQIFPSETNIYNVPVINLPCANMKTGDCTKITSSDKNLEHFGKNTIKIMIKRKMFITIKSKYVLLEQSQITLSRSNFKTATRKTPQRTHKILFIQLAMQNYRNKFDFMISLDAV